MTDYQDFSTINALGSVLLWVVDAVDDDIDIQSITAVVFDSLPFLKD
jgi:hypothetical protein